MSYPQSTLYPGGALTPVNHFTSVADGAWNDGATWGNASPGLPGVDYPSGVDSFADVAAGTAVTASAAAGCYRLTVGGTLAVRAPVSITDNGVDAMVIDGGTAIVEANLTIGATPGAVDCLVVTGGGALSVPALPIADVTVTVHGTLRLDATGRIDVGSEATPLAANRAFELVFHTNTNATSVWRGGLCLHGAERELVGVLAADAAPGDTALTFCARAGGPVTGWSAGERLALTRFTRNHADHMEIVTIDAVTHGASASVLTVSGAGPGGGIVGPCVSRVEEDYGDWAVSLAANIVIRSDTRRLLGSYWNTLRLLPEAGDEVFIRGVLLDSLGTTSSSALEVTGASGGAVTLDRIAVFVDYDAIGASVTTRGLYLAFAKAMTTARVGEIALAQCTHGVMLGNDCHLTEGESFLAVIGDNLNYASSGLLVGTSMSGVIEELWVSGHASGLYGPLLAWYGQAGATAPFGTIVVKACLVGMQDGGWSRSAGSGYWEDAPEVGPTACNFVDTLRCFALGDAGLISTGVATRLDTLTVRGAAATAVRMNGSGNAPLAARLVEVGDLADAGSVFSTLFGLDYSSYYHHSVEPLMVIGRYDSTRWGPPTTADVKVRSSAHVAAIGRGDFGAPVAVDLGYPTPTLPGALLGPERPWNHSGVSVRDLGELTGVRAVYDPAGEMRSLAGGGIAPPQAAMEGIVFSPVNTRPGAPLRQLIRVPVRPGQTRLVVYLSVETAGWDGEFILSWGTGVSPLSALSPSRVRLGAAELSAAAYDGAATGWARNVIDLGAVTAGSVEPLALEVWDGAANPGALYLAIHGVLEQFGETFGSFPHGVGHSPVGSAFVRSNP